MDKIITQELRFVDGAGRTRLFNGMNIDDKLIDCSEFRYNLDDEFFRRYRANGLDIVRLAVTWQNLEPQMDCFNESYLQSLDRIFESAEKYGVYILLDMHQDLYSGNGGKSVGDGAPEWAVITDGAKPRLAKFVWAEGYFWGKWVHRSFDHFWNNDPVENGEGLQDRYCKVWKMLAKRYGDSPALFGFDLMNEPFPGSDSKKMFVALGKGAVKVFLFTDKLPKSRMIKALFKRDIPVLLDCISGDAIKAIVAHVNDLAKQFDLNKYSPFLNKTAAAIREITSNGIIMMEQSYLSNVGVKQSAPPITVNGVREPMQCFGPHSYDMTVDTPLYKYANADRVKTFFSEMRNTQLRLGVPVIVGEWGGCSDNTDTSWFPHAYELLEFFDGNHWSQAYWDYHGDDLDAPIMNLLRRTHPVAVAGDIISYNYNRDNSVFTLSYKADGSGETTVYVHKSFTCDNADYSVLEEYENGASLIAFAAKPGINEIKLTVNE